MRLITVLDTLKYGGITGFDVHHEVIALLVSRVVAAVPPPPQRSAWFSLFSLLLYEVNNATTVVTEATGQKRKLAVALISENQVLNAL